MSAVIMESNASGLSAWKTRWIYMLVFLFPIAGVSVSHWYTTIFALLAFTALWDVFRHRAQAPLLKDEKIWLICCVGFFASFLLSAVVNGWDVGQKKSIEVDIRYLFAVPLYLMLRRFPEAGKYLLAGVLLSAIALAAQAYYDTEIRHLPRAQGFYSPNLLGPVAVLTVMWGLLAIRFWQAVKWAIVVPVFAALYAVVMSGSRGAYLGFIVVSLLLAVLANRGRWRILASSVVLIGVVGVYYESSYVKERVDRVVTDAVIYVEAETPAERTMDDAGVRFELWHVAWYSFLEKPIAGIGNKHFNDYAKKYVAEGRVDPSVIPHHHAHNAFLHVLATRGLIGFVFFVGMLFYPLYLFAKTYRASPETALLGISHIVGFAVFSLTDASTFIMGNFTSIFVLCMAIFMTWHVSRLQGAKR